MVWGYAAAFTTGVVVGAVGVNLAIVYMFAKKQY